MEKTENPKQSCCADEVEETVVEKMRNWDGAWMCRYNGFWCPLMYLQPILSFQKHFEAAATDIIVATFPKSGTTWLKALTFSIINRCSFSIDRSPLLNTNPHSLVPFLEINLYRQHQYPDLKNIPSPRIFSTHVPYQLLPETIKESDCRVIYMCRNPLDQFISLWHFLAETKVETEGTGQYTPMDEAFEMYCQGNHAGGPFWEHMLEYWNAHLKNPEKILFLTYEDLKKDTMSKIKKIAEFIGYPFSLEEEKQGLIQQICDLCSFNNLKNLEINKVGTTNNGLKNSSFFRKGDIGDWTNHLTPSMAERLGKVVEMKFKGSGLMFNT